MLQDLPLCSKLTFTSALCQTHLDDWLDDTLSPGPKHPKGPVLLQPRHSTSAKQVPGKQEEAGLGTGLCSCQHLGDGHFLPSPEGASP